MHVERMQFIVLQPMPGLSSMDSNGDGHRIPDNDEQSSQGIQLHAVLVEPTQRCTKLM